VRISNLPSTVTKEQLLKRLDIGSELCVRLNLPDKPNPSSSMVAYLINQPSENFIRHKILAWHDKTFSEATSNKMQCQLEMNMDFFDWDDKTDLLAANARSRASSSASSTVGNIRSTITKIAPWYKGKKESNVNDDEPTKTNIQTKRNGNVGDSESTVHIREPADMAQLAPQWRWTNKRLSNDQAGMGCIYSLVNKENKQIKAAIKVYMTQHNPTARLYAQHDKIVLEKLTGKQTILSSLIVNLHILLGLNGVPKLILSNIDAENGTELNNDLWIIMEHIEGVTLHEFMRNHSISLRDELLITLHLLDIVKQIHNRHVIHGNINPQNIIIKTESIPDNDNSQFSCDKISLLLTDFSLASINQEDNEQNGRMFFPSNQNSAFAVGYNYSQPQEIFYCTPQIEMQSAMNDTEKNKQHNFWHSPTIDTSHIGAILFYMITKCYPRESRDINGQAPHEIKKHISIINEELKKATGK